MGCRGPPWAAVGRRGTSGDTRGHRGSVSSFSLCSYVRKGETIAGALCALKTHRADACPVLLLLFLFVWNRQPETCAPTSILSAPSSVVSPRHRVARQGPHADAAHPPLPPHTWNDASLSFSDRLTSRGLTSSRLVPVTPRGWTSFFTA